MSETACLFVYITAPDTGMADSLAQALVEEGLCACANIIPSMKAVYRWEGRLCEEQEVVMILKTTQDRFAALTARVKALHPYECPCIIGLPLSVGSADYLDWIRAQCMGGQGR